MRVVTSFIFAASDLKDTLPSKLLSTTGSVHACMKSFCFIQFAYLERRSSGILSPRDVDKDQRRAVKQNMRELMGQTCMAGFYPAFKQNMEAIGLPVPTGLFATQQQAASTIGQLLGKR